MKQMLFEIPVGKMPAMKKRWWQFWRKKGDSAEEFLKSFNMNRYLRKAKASELWGIHRPDWENELWFPNK